MGPWLWFILVFLHIIRSAAGTLFLSLPNSQFSLFSNVTLTWRRQPQDPTQFLLQTRPPSPLDNSLVDARNDSGVVNLVFQSTGSFALQAVDPNNPDNLLQETTTFVVDMARDPTTTAAPTSTRVFNPSGIITIIQTQSSTSVVTSTQTTIINEPTSASPERAASRPNVTGIVAGTVCGVLLLILIIVILLWYLPRRKRQQGRRHTFHPEMMTEGSGTPVPPKFAPGEVYQHRGSSFEILPQNSPAFGAFAASEMAGPSSSNNWIGRRPNQPYSPFVNDIRQLPSPPVPPSKGMTQLNVPPITTQWQSQTVSEEDDAPLTARTSVGSNTAEMRTKMREALEKMRMMRRSGQQPPPPRLDLSAA